MTEAANTNDVPAIDELLGVKITEGDVGVPLPLPPGMSTIENEEEVPALPLLVAIAARLDSIDARIAGMEQRQQQETAFTAMAEAGELVFNTVALVNEFHTAFGVPVERVPCLPSDARLALRLDLIEEKLGELREALQAAMDARAVAGGHPEAVSDFAMVRIAKEMADLQYVLDGTFLELGLGAVKGHLVNAVHASNMSKLDADGKPVYRGDGKVLKGLNYAAPDAALAEILALAANPDDVEG